MGEQPQSLPPGSFSIGVKSDDDHFFVTVSIPRIVDLPYLGQTSLQAIGASAAIIAVPWLWWYGRRTARRWRQYISNKREARAEALRKAESPARATKWESKSHRKLDEFMSEEIAPARQRLRKVEDPDTVAKRVAKRERIKTEQAKKPKGKLGLSDDLLTNTRGSLRKLEEASPKEPKEKKPEFSDLLQKSRSGLRQSADAPLASYLEDSKSEGEEDGKDRTVDGNVDALPEDSVEEDIDGNEQSNDANGTDESGGDDGKCIIS
ncbi:hypothetical protein ACHAXT_012637 [Thalassiosira profunda]